jgi:chitinase
MKIIPHLLLLTALLLFVALPASSAKQKLVIAYVCSWTDLRLPDPTLMTNINYAFGHVNKTFDGCDIQNEPFLRKVVALKKINPKLKVQLSVGGWTSGNFSEMAADARCRKSFANDCARIVREYGLDGIDIDWEYPTSNEAGISCSPSDTKNFTLLMRDLRKALGKDKLLTAATIAYAKYIDFKACIKYMDFINIMAYDVANPPQHHTTLFRSPLSGKITTAEAVEAHVAAGVPKDKICLGMPLYGRGDHSNPVLDKYMKTGYTAGLYTEHWDSVGQVPYLTDWSGQLVWAADNPRSIAAKCQYILDEDLLGGMYWEVTEDDAQGDLMQTVYLSLMRNGKATIPHKRILLITDGRHADDVAFFTRLGDRRGYDVTVTTPADSYAKGSMSHYHLICNLGPDPGQWPADAKADFEKYIDQGQGSYLATDADTTAQWKWYNQFIRKKEEKRARSVIYKRHPGLGYMPKANTYEATRERAVEWLLHEHHAD